MGPQDNHLTVMTDLIQLYNRDTSTRDNIMFTFYVLALVLVSIVCVDNVIFPAYFHSLNSQSEKNIITTFLKTHYVFFKGGWVG